MRLASLTFVAAAALAPLPSTAATVKLGSGTMDWSTSTPAVGLVESGNKMSWGQTHSAGGFNQSFYEFDAAASGSTAAESTEFLMGTFTHGNFAIANVTNGAIDSAKLTYQIDLTFDLGGGAEYVESFDFLWDFDHLETLNRAPTTCANGLANKTGINSSGCADSVDFSAQESEYEFLYDEGVVTLQILGFRPGTSFWTAENAENQTGFYAVFTFEPAAVPLPAAGWLLLGGLAALGAARRRSRA